MCAHTFSWGARAGGVPKGHTCVGKVGNLILASFRESMFVKRKVNNTKTIPRYIDDWDGLESRRAGHFACEAIH